MLESRANHPVLGPSSLSLEILVDGVFTEKMNLQKTNGQEVSTRLVLEGSGMAGLEDPLENREWAGMFNHYAKTAGVTLLLAELLKLNGHEVDPQLLLDGVMVSHNGRRQTDEAQFYKDQVKGSEERASNRDDYVSNNNLLRFGAPQDLIDIVSVHGLGRSFPFEDARTWSQKLPLYLDYRITQTPVTLDQRLEGLQSQVPHRITQEFLDETRAWVIPIENEVFEALYLKSYDEIAKNPRNLKARIKMAIKIGKFSENEAKILGETTLFKPKLGTTVDFAVALGLEQEEFMERLQLYPEDITEAMAKPERWEGYIRRLYINDAEVGIFDRLTVLHEGIGKGTATKEDLDGEFPEGTWWGEYARELYANRGGKVLEPREFKKRGI